MKKTRILLLLTIYAATISAQETWSLQNCIDYALEHNIQVKKNRISQAENEVSLWQDKGALFPSLSFSTSHNIGYRPFTQVMSVIQDQQVTSTRSNVTYGGSYGLNANVTLWNGGINYKNIEAQKLQNRISELNTEQSELTIQEQIAKYYVQIMYTKEAQKVNEQLLQTANSQYERGVEMMNEGLMAEADVAQLEAQLSSARYSVVNSQTQLADYKRQLKALLELDLTTPFDVTGNLPTDEQVLALIPSAEEAYEKALCMRPEIQSAELGIEAANMRLDIARRGYLPTISANAGINSNHTSGSSKKYGEQMKSNVALNAGLNLSVPIFNNRRTASSIKTAKLEQLNSQLELQDKKNALSSTIEQYWINANNNQHNYLAAKSRVKSQDASYELLNEQFRNGLKNTVDLLQGRDNVVSAKQDMLQSKYTALLNIQLLKFYTGEKIEL